MVREIELCSAKPKPCSLPPLSFLSWPCSWKILIYFNSLFSCQLPICHDILISVLRKPRYHSWIHDSVRDVLDVFVTSCKKLSRSNSVAPWILKIRIAADSPLQSRASSFKVQWLHDSAILSAGVACTSGGWCRLMLWCVAGSRHCLLSALKAFDVAPTRTSQEGARSGGQHLAGIQVAILQDRLSDYVSCVGMRLYNIWRPSPAPGLPGWAGRQAAGPVESHAIKWWLTGITCCYTELHACNQI